MPLEQPRIGSMAFEVGRLLNQHREALLWAEIIAHKNPGFDGARDRLAEQGEMLEATFGFLKDLARIGEADVSAFMSSRLGPS